MLAHLEINQRLIRAYDDSRQHAPRGTRTLRPLEDGRGSAVPVVLRWQCDEARWACWVHLETKAGLPNASTVAQRLAPLLAWIAQTVEAHPSGMDPMHFGTGGAGWSTSLRWDIVPAWEVQDHLRRRLREVGVLLNAPGPAALAGPRVGRSS